jgi:hypothetical protein
MYLCSKCPHGADTCSEGTMCRSKTGTPCSYSCALRPEEPTRHYETEDKFHLHRERWIKLLPGKKAKFGSKVSAFSACCVLIVMAFLALSLSTLLSNIGGGSVLSMTGGKGT